jgi:transcriptional regulator with XRE-family HTH domain
MARQARRPKVTHQYMSASTPATLRTLAPGVSLCALSKLTGIALSHLSRIFSGQRGLTIDKARIIAKAVGRSITDVADVLQPQQPQAPSQS